MEHTYIAREQDKNIIADYKKRFEAETLEALVESYNRQVKCGIVGVHQQALYLIALKKEFKERLKESPVYLLQHILGLVGPIEVVDGNIGIKGIKLQGKPVCRQRQALNPIIGIDPRVEVLNLDPAEKGGISSTFNFQCVILTSQN